MIAPTLDETVKRIRIEYTEMPDMRLSFAQARRLWNLPPDRCESALAVLVQSGFLARTPDGCFLRRAAERELLGRGARRLFKQMAVSDDDAA